MEDGFISRFSYFEGPITDKIELMIFQNFWSWLLDLKKRCDDALVSIKFYVYAGPAAEYKQIYELTERSDPSRSKASIDEFLRGESWVDLLSVVKSALISSSDYSLKTVAKWAGFNWRSTDPGGDQSQAWYEAVVADNNSESRKMLKQLLEYNEDDVLATKSLREWLDKTTFRSISMIEI
jgi:predicted RecB family nuclease